MENYKNESMVDVAFSVLTEKNQIMKFADLYKEVCEKLEFSQEEKLAKISNFYTDLTLDGRFVGLVNNEWDLRTNQSFEKSHINMKDYYAEMEKEAKENRDLEELDKEELAAEGIDAEDSDDAGESDYEEVNKEF